MTPVAFVLAAGLGAVLRYLAGLGRVGWGSTLVVNVVGALLLGWLVAGGGDGRIDGEARTVVGVGFCGALTTFSTLVLDVERATPRARWLIVGAHLGLGVGAAWLGWSLGG